jgi:hypothetical protein
LISLLVLTFGLLTLLSILQKTLTATEPVEFETRAALLAQSILEGIRSDPGGFPFIPGVNSGTWPVVERNLFETQGESLLVKQDGAPFGMEPLPSNASRARIGLPFVFSIPGNGNDDDALLHEQPDERWADDGQLPGTIPFNGADDLTEAALRARGLIFGPTSKRDLDGQIEADVNENILGAGALDGEDSDNDGIPDDTGDYFNPYFDLGQIYGLPSPNPYKPDGDFSYDPQRHIDEEFPNGKDDDEDGFFDEDLCFASQYRPILSIGDIPQDRIPYNYLPTFPGNGINDDGDELIDEEFYDGEDNDGDGRVDEDCKAALMPFQPFPLPAPNDEYSFQIGVRRLAVGGDLIDNDGDSFTDEEFFNGLDDPGGFDPFQGLVPDQDKFVDEDVGVYAAPGAMLVTVYIFQGDDRQDNDDDGWIDEEPLDGIDNDNDGLTDEDHYRRVFRTTGLVRLRE